MIEDKCIDVVAQVLYAELNHEQWQAITALHRTLIHEHHDFMLATQHPLGSRFLKGLAFRNRMLDRLWKYCVYDYLELLRGHLPTTREHMLTFNYLAYSMYCLHYETLPPAFEKTLMERLGDIARHRLALEDEDPEQKAVWTSVSQNWYSRLYDQNPTTGRLCHHLAILARPDALKQLFFYGKSLCVFEPFTLAHKSILTLFKPAAPFEVPVEAAFVESHRILFSQDQTTNFLATTNGFFLHLKDSIKQSVEEWTERGYHVAIANCCALLSYGRAGNVIISAIHSQSNKQQAHGQSDEKQDHDKGSSFDDAICLAMGSLKVFLQREHEAMWPHVHVVMVFMLRLTLLPDILRYFQDSFPWALLSRRLNELPAADEESLSDEFPEGSDGSPLPEDFALRGLPFTDMYFPSNWFSNDISYEDKFMEMPSLAHTRQRRLLWLGRKIAQAHVGLIWDAASRQFSDEESSWVMVDVDGDQIEQHAETPANHTELGVLPSVQCGFQ
ncbi:hypothetical protein F4808DRAFT_70602 [Astrocystis sublimbata]|nr:hypothetical protein F4808DRAFT_70602 [Astrocystis sublimbata]